MDIEFKGQYDTAAIRQAVELVQTPARPLQSLRLLALLGSLAVIFYAVQTALADRFLNTLEMLEIVIPLVIILYFLIEPWLKKRRLAKVIQGDRQPALMAGRITGAGVIYYKSPANQAPGKEIPWEAFAHAAKSGDLLALLTVDGVLAIFPRSFFHSQQDWDTFQALAKEKVIPRRIR